MNPDVLQSLQAALQAGSLSAILAQPWAICVPSLAAEYMAGRVKLRIGPSAEVRDPGAMTWDEYCEQKAEARNGLQIHSDTGVAIQPIKGVMYSGASTEDEAFYGAFNTDRIARTCQAVAADPSIKTLVFQMRTPGGSVFGLESAAKSITALQARRRGLDCVAWTAHLCASAGMYVAAACGSIHAAPSALVGSIGTISSLTDTKGLWDKLGITKHIFTADSALKALGAGGVAPSAEHLAHMDAMTRMYSGEFKSWMKKRRNLKPDDMQGQYGEARHAPAGMVDTACFLSMEQMLATGLGL